MRWLPVVGFEGLYEVSDEGHVLSLYGPNPKILKPIIRPGDYDAVSLRRERKTYRRLVHLLVITTFVGPRPDGMVCRHIDGDHRNNGLSNLCWGTQKENSQDTVLHGRSGRPRILTAEQVEEIRSEPEWHGHQTWLAAKYGVSQPCISKLRNLMPGDRRLASNLTGG